MHSRFEIIALTNELIVLPRHAIYDASSLTVDLELSYFHNHMYLRLTDRCNVILYSVFGSFVIGSVKIHVNGTLKFAL